ncbi:MAG: hypothetical protein IJF15_06875 [Oscillospiraceae bacterium]|nr:hypothetical protein [Oscillospiraceae bacterium]
MKNQLQEKPFKKKFCRISCKNASEGGSCCSGKLLFRIAVIAKEAAQSKSRSGKRKTKSIDAFPALFRRL